MGRASASLLDPDLKAIGFDQCGSGGQTPRRPLMCRQTPHLIVSILATLEAAAAPLAAR